VYETFEHTADLGLRIATADLAGLFREAGEALFSVIVGDGSAPADGAVHREFRIAGDRADWLLVDWLAELLYVFDTEHLLLSGFEVEIDAQGVRARAAAEPFDAARHRVLHEVKAVTYHALRVERTAAGWLAEVVLDI
jgi:SHS2 domain-containing protein